MGRLFWKFFFFFWLAQIVTSVGVGVSIWLEHSAHGPGPGAFDGGPPPPGFAGLDRPPPPGRLPPPVMPIVAGSVVSLLFAALLAWYFAKPIRSLRAAFDAVAGGRLETRVGSSMSRRNDELADLGSDFDRMAERLQSLLDTQRRLLHDVSHELRSPLARLQAAADLMRQQPERAAEFAERIERDTARMDKLVGELLTLARLDAGMTGNLDEEVDVGEIIGHIADDAQFEADAMGCTVEAEFAGLLVVAGSHELIYRALENVVRNAVRHSPQGGSVAISGQADDAGHQVCVMVADRGSGVFPDDLDAIFEPFYRSGPGGVFSGYGLGLAITRRIVEAHGGKVFAANRPEGGLLVTLALPISQIPHERRSV